MLQPCCSPAPVGGAGGQTAVARIGNPRTWRTAPRPVGLKDTGGTFVPHVDRLISLPAGATAIPGWTTLNAELIWARNDNIYAQSPFGSFFLDLTG